MIGGDPASRVLIPDCVHPLLGAVGRAFADHRPLTLSPDAVWLTIAQGVAQHIRLHPDDLRPRLAGDEDAGRKQLSIDVVDFPDDADAWCQIVEAYDKLLAAQIADADLFACDFSTSTEVDRMAGRIVMLDAYSPYFALSMSFICGIPVITLTGTVDDWSKIWARVDRVAGWGLETWCRSLVAILDQFVAAVDGRVDTAF